MRKEAALLLTGILAFVTGTVYAIGKTASLRIAAKNILWTIKLDKWKFTKGKFQTSIIININNPDLNENINVLFPQVEVFDKDKEPIQLSTVPDALIDKTYTILSRKEITFDPIVMEVPFMQFFKLLKTIGIASMPEFKSLYQNILLNLLTPAKIDITLMDDLFSKQATTINANYSGKITTRINGLQIIYEFKFA